jgi:hypothetical protein
MSKTVYKYDLETAPGYLALPAGAKVLCVQTQQETPRLWVLVDPNPNRAAVIRRFVIVGTGHTVTDEHAVWDYIGTFQLHAGTLVFHVFMGPEE